MVGLYQEVDEEYKMENKKVNVNFDGNDYIEYLKYKDSKKIKINKTFIKRIKEFWSVAWIYYAIAGVLSIIAIFLNMSMQPPPPETSMITIYGIQVVSYIPTFLLGCIGIAWVLHGVGFIIIRR